MIHQSYAFLFPIIPPAFLSRDYWVETLIPPKRSAPVGGFCIERAALFPHPFRMDAQRNPNAVHKIPS